MKPYLVTATDPGGRRDTFAREAASPMHLRALLEREGYGDIELVDDEVTAQLREQWPEELKPKNAADYRFQARLRKDPTPSASWWLQAARNNWLPLSLAAAAVAWGIWSRSIGWSVAGLAVVALWAWVVRRGMGQVNDYNTLLAAYARGEHDVVEELIARMEDSPAVEANEQLGVDLLARQACLLARRGQLQDGLALVAPLAGGPHAANGMQEMRVASIHYAADDTDGFVDGLERACEASGRNATMVLDLAFAHARLGDVQRARALLGEVPVQSIPDLQRPIHRAVEGVLLLREGAHAEAADILGEAADALDAYAANPSVWPFNGMLSGYLALALLGCGRREDAEAAFAPWREVALNCLEPASRQRLASEFRE